LSVGARPEHDAERHRRPLGRQGATTEVAGLLRSTTVCRGSRTTRTRSPSTTTHFEATATSSRNAQSPRNIVGPRPLLYGSEYSSGPNYAGVWGPLRNLRLLLLSRDLQGVVHRAPGPRHPRAQVPAVGTSSRCRAPAPLGGGFTPRPAPNAKPPGGDREYHYKRHAAGRPRDASSSTPTSPCST